MNYCFNKDFISELIKVEIEKKHSENHELIEAINLSKEWQAQLKLLNYLLGIVLLGYKKKNSETNTLQTLESCYSLNETGFLELDEIDEDFVSYMLRFKRIRDLSLEEELIFIQEDYHSHIYDRTFRY